MAHNVEPMDISIEGDFDNKENTFHHSNVLQRTPCTEKGYEELDVSELNMKLRYSITPASSPMSKSYTAHCLDNRNSECPDNTSNSIDNANLTRSFNSLLNKNDTLSKPSKLQPLQLHTADQSLDKNRNASVLRPLDTTVSEDGNNVTVTVTEVHDIDENLSLPSSSSSALHTPEATTPTKDMPKTDGGSPIMRGLKSVLNMFRASQSPIPPAENEDINDLGEPLTSSLSSDKSQVALASTPIAARNKRESLSKRGSPLKDSIVFNEDLEKELLWKDETTILFSEEKIPIHKLFYQQTKNASHIEKAPTTNAADANLNETVEFMDVSYNDSAVNNKTITDIVLVTESDSEFVDCETTFTQQLDSEQSTEPTTALSDDPAPIQNINESAQESQIPMGEECNNKQPGNTTYVEETPIQGALEELKVNVEEKHETLLTASNNQEPETKLCTETEKEHLSGSSFTMESQVGEIPLLSTSLNPTQDITEQKEHLVTPSNVDNVEKFELSLNVTQDTGVKESEHNNKTLDSTVNIDSSDKPVSVSTFIMNSTQNITQISCNPLNESLNTVAINDVKTLSASVLSTENSSNQLDTKDVKDKQIFTASFTQISQSQLENLNTIVTESHPVLSTDANSNTQIIDDQFNNDSNSPLGVTVSSNNMVPSSSTLKAQDIESNAATNKTGNDQDSITKSVDYADQPASSTFMAEITQDIKSHMSPLDAEGDFTVDTTNGFLDNTVPVDPAEKPVSSTFIQDIESHVPALDNIVTVDPTEKPVSSTLIKDIAQDIESHMLTLDAETFVSKEKKHEVLDSTVTVDSPVSSTFIKDVTQDFEFNTSTDTKQISLSNVKLLDSETKRISSTLVNDSKAPGIELSEITITAESMQSQTSFTKDLTHIIDGEVAISENKTSNSAEVIKETCKSSEYLNATSSPNKSKTLSKDSPYKAEKSLIESTSDFHLNNRALLLSTVIEEKSSLNPDIETDIGNPIEVLLPLTGSEDITVLSEEKQIVNEQERAKENIQKNFDDTAVNPVMQKIDANFVHLNSTETIMLPENNSYGENLPVDIPLPDNDIEFGPLPDQLAHGDTSLNSGVLPDVINDLNPSTIQYLNKIYEVPINMKLDYVEAPTDLNTSYVKTDVLETDHKSITEHNDYTIKIENIISDIVENEMLMENIMESAKSIEKVETKLEKQPEVMDISCNNHDIILHKDSEIGTMDKEVHVQSQNVSEGLSESENKIMHEQITVSDNDSPYVLVSCENNIDNKTDSSLDEDFEKIDNPFVGTSNITASEPKSPPIASKGYNFNFDDIEDPFATKTKIRTSPPLDSPRQMNKQEEKVEVARKNPISKNKRKSYPVRPKPATTKKNFNSSFDGSLSTQKTTDKSTIINKKPLNEKDLSLHKQEDATETLNILHNNINTETNVIEKSEWEQNVDSTFKSATISDNQNKKNNDDVSPITQSFSEVPNVENKSSATSTAPSSSDQSIYLSAGNSSVESIPTKNVFNLPEIDDMNFNPFATKSKINLSPPPSLKIGDPIITETEIVSGNDAVKVNALDLTQENNCLDENDSSNISIATCSSKDDKNTTVREAHTDDDDTIEGPFLETEDTEMIDLGLQNEIKDKLLAGFDIENDMMEFSDLPTQDNEDNELFIDAAAYEFLLNQNKSNVVTDSGKESLFLKFDPLFAKRLSSEGIAAALSKIQKRQNTPKKMSRVPPLPSSDQAFAGPSTSNVSTQQLDTTVDIAEDLNITTSKPMMVVTPAVNQIAKPRKSTTPTSSNRRSITFTSPAIAVIDRLLSLSANNSLVDHNTTITHVSREHDEAEQALTQLRELLAEKEINVYNLRTESTELKDRLLTLESQMKVLEKESDQRLKKVNELNEKLTEKSKINKSMAAVVEEYERTIASLIAETEQDRKRHEEERTKLIKERDEQTAHLASMEVSFSDLHSKYEKSKQIILSCKANEDTYKKSIKEFEENLTKMQTNYETLKQHATSKLNHANQELEKMNKAHESEVLKLNAMIKRKELHITSLEETLAQKTKANEELTAICDELINKVG